MEISAEKVQIAMRHLGNNSTSLANREMQIKKTWKFHLHNSEWLRSKTLMTINTRVDVEKREGSMSNKNTETEFGDQHENKKSKAVKPLEKSYLYRDWVNTD